MRVVFLDFDGVIVHMAGPRRRRPGATSGGHIVPDPACVARLNRIVACTGAVVVVSSTWRLNRTIRQLQEELEAAGFQGKVIGATPDDGLWASRDDEIRAWLADHPAVEAYVVLDDEAMASFGDRMVWIEQGFERGGLADQHVRVAIGQLWAAR